MASSVYGPEPYADLWRFRGSDYQDAFNDPLSSPSPQVQALIDQGLITRTQHQGINEGGAFNYFTDDFNTFDPRVQQVLPKSTVPTTNFNWMPVVPGQTDRLIDPSLVYHDANYGLLTPTFNDKANKGDWQDMIGPLVMAAVTFGAGALASGAAAGAGAAAAEGGLEAGAGAGAAGAGWAGSTLSSVPWYISAGQTAAKTLGGMALGGNTGYTASDYGIPNNLLTPIQKSTPTTSTIAPTPSFYDPTAYGNMGAMGGFGNTAAPGDGSERVASAIAPDAYGNSYNSVTT